MKMMKSHTFYTLFLLLLLAANTGVRRVENQTLISTELPSIRIEMEDSFEYAGSFPFRIGDIAEGERFVFVDAKGKTIQRLFVAQFEGFLPESAEIYRYNFDNALELGGHRFRHSVFAFSIEKDRKQNPRGEGVLTHDFLKGKGYIVPDEWMASRFLTLGDEKRKHELILFYMEDVARTGFQVKQFYDGEEETDIWKALIPDLVERSRKAFHVLS